MPIGSDDQAWARALALTELEVIYEASALRELIARALLPARARRSRIRDPYCGRRVLRGGAHAASDQGHGRFFLRR